MIHGEESDADRGLWAQENEENVAETSKRVRTAVYPPYSEVRKLLTVWPGWPRSQVTQFRAKVMDLTGTPREPVDWTDPDRWIEKKLTGEYAALAQEIWKAGVNPRYTTGHWLLIQNYALLEDGPDGMLHLTPSGRDFRDKEFGETEKHVDQQEGVVQLLSFVADSGPAPVGKFNETWSDYLESVRSPYKTETTIRDSLRRRLNNLLDRGLIDRKANHYTVTDTGLAYLDSGEDPLFSELQRLVRKQEASVRDQLRRALLELDPFAFEHLIKRLLIEMGYRDVKVTKASGDGGVDVVGKIELGITSIREVVQAKRHSRTIQRTVLDALRGSLFRFGAVRGTIITTSKFARGAEETALELGAPPITLIDGEKLSDLLIEHEIGVRKRRLDALQVDVDAFEDLGGSE